MGKQTVKMELTQSNNIRQRLQVRLIGKVFIQVANDESDAVVVVHAAILSQRDWILTPDSCGEMEKRERCSRQRSYIAPEDNEIHDL